MAYRTLLQRHLKHASTREEADKLAREEIEAAVRKELRKEELILKDENLARRRAQAEATKKLLEEQHKLEQSVKNPKYLVNEAERHLLLQRALEEAEKNITKRDDQQLRDAIFKRKADEKKSREEERLRDLELKDKLLRQLDEQDSFNLTRERMADLAKRTREEIERAEREEAEKHLYAPLPKTDEEEEELHRPMSMKRAAYEMRKHHEERVRQEAAASEIRRLIELYRSAAREPTPPLLQPAPVKPHETPARLPKLSETPVGATPGRVDYSSAFRKITLEHHDWNLHRRQEEAAMMARPESIPPRVAKRFHRAE